MTIQTSYKDFLRPCLTKSEISKIIFWYFWYFLTCQIFYVSHREFHFGRLKSTKFLSSKSMEEDSRFRSSLRYKDFNHKSSSTSNDLPYKNPSYKIIQDLKPIIRNKADSPLRFLSQFTGTKYILMVIWNQKTKSDRISRRHSFLKILTTLSYKFTSILYRYFPINAWVIPL